MTKRSLFLAGAGLVLAPAAALAQTAPAAPATATTVAKTPAVGATILDSAGVTIGTVESVTPQAIVVANGATKVALPPAAIGSTPKGFALSMTKAELDAAQAQQQQAASAAVKSRLVAGTSVNGLNGATLGTIKSSDGTNVTLTTPSGDAVVPATGFAAGANNTIVLGLTAQQLNAMLGGAKGGAAASTTGPAATTATTGTATTGTTTTAGSTTGDTGMATGMTGTASTGTTTGATTPTDGATAATSGSSGTATTTATPTSRKTTSKTVRTKTRR